MHERYVKWNSVYVRFRRWAEQRVRDAGNAGRFGSHRRLAAYDRQYQCSRPRLGSGRKRGCANALAPSRGGFTGKSTPSVEP
ncbi:hypothetical protein [Erythrobacter westpacificensis]|uniref:hypothetical protein n=1 Tax=Erythrobacter westpacificensis TaxID=1055231 RepID=UPI0031F9821A